MSRPVPLPHADLTEHLPASLHETIHAVLRGDDPDPITTTTASDYLNQLSTLNLRSPSEISNFAFITQIGPTDPIKLGAHAGMTFFLIPDMESVPEISNRKPSPVEQARGFLDEVKSYQALPVANSLTLRPNFEFGFGLGYLTHIETRFLPTDGSLPDITSLRRTGFFILLNCLDRSVWMAIDWFPLNDYGDNMSLDGEDWGRLPNDMSVQIGVMQISQPQWQTPPSGGTLSISAADPFSRNISYGCRLVAKKAVERDYMNYITAAQQAAQAST